MAISKEKRRMWVLPAPEGPGGNAWRSSVVIGYYWNVFVAIVVTALGGMAIVASAIVHAGASFAKGTKGYFYSLDERVEYYVKKGDLDYTTKIEVDDFREKK